MSQGREHSSLVEIRGLRFARGARMIFDGGDNDNPHDKNTTIMGPSGTGKTTLLNLIGGQLQPQAGRVVVDGEDALALKRRELYDLRKRIGMLFQTGALRTDLDVFDNVAFPLR